MAPSIAFIIGIISLAVGSPIHHVVAFSTPAATSSSRVSTPARSDCIESPSTSRLHGSALFMAKGTANSDNKGKKRRFLQQAHPVPPPAPASQQPIRSPKANGAAAGSNLGSLTGKNTVENNSNPAESSVKPKTRRGPPLQTSKSIDELEAILEKRWGTAQTSKPKKVKADDEDADFVLSFGNDDDDYEDDTPSRSSPKSKSPASNNLKGAAVFRSRNRVMDPWAKEEGLYDKPKKDSSSDDDDSDSGNTKERYDWKKDEKAKQQRYNKQDAMLNRVRSNQERLQSTKTPNDGKKSDGEKNKKDYIKVPIDVSKDYYDEDDEGYDNQGSNLISPRPVGGRGSFKSDSASSSGLSGGIFSDRSMETPREYDKKEVRSERRRAEALAEEEKKKRPKRKMPNSPSLLDENGNEMFLTLEQADKIVQGILSTSSDGDTASDGGDNTTGSDDDSNNQWEDLGITDATLLSNLQSSTMSCPSPLAVQDRACPPIVAGNDVLISTHTGSGKTLAFLAPIAQSLLMNSADNKNKQGQFPKAIVVAPGRELASQIVSVAQSLFKDTGLTVSMAIGGTPYSRNVEQLRKKKPDLVVGTPGRIAELIIGKPGEKGGKLKVSGLQTVVLDEFDALLQYGIHKDPTMAIMDALDRQHGQQSSLQKVLCSATASDMLKSSSDGKMSIEDFLRPGYAHASVDENDVLVTAGVEVKGKGGMTTSARVSRTTIHGALHVPHQRLALEAVRKILNTEPIPQQALIFVDSPRRVEIVIEKLAQMDIVAAPLHGGASSGKGDRAQVNKALREGYVGIVVATEMAARGIDAPYLTHVINLDLPTDASHYAHRAGRCGRGGRPGVAVSITCDVREKNVPKRFGEELGITMYNVEARESKLRIVE